MKVADPSAQLRRRALRLEYATIAWNVGEAFLTIGLGIAAGSLALIGFGSVSIVEVAGSAAVVWQLRPSEEFERAARTRRALRFIALAFLALALILATFAVRDLITGREARESLTGIAYLTATAIVMFGLARAKHRLAEAMRSEPLRSEAKMTFLDGVLSTLTLLGLTANAAAGWAWADPTAALIVSVAALHESRANWREAAEASIED